jgi:hypothetical protein
MEIERLRLLALLASRFVMMPEAAPVGSRIVVLCDGSVAIIEDLISACYRRATEEVVQAAMEALMAHPS